MNKKNVFAKSMRCITIIIIGKVDKFNEITICYFGQQRITWSIWVAHFTTIKHHVVHFPTPRAHIWTKNLKRNKLLPVSYETNLNNKLTIMINAWNLPLELDIKTSSASGIVIIWRIIWTSRESNTVSTSSTSLKKGAINTDTFTRGVAIKKEWPYINALAYL